MEHLWTKIKSWISSYLTTSNISDLSSYMDDWKANNFGSGSYIVSSSSSLSIRNNSSVAVNHESEIDLDDDAFTIKGVGEIKISASGYSITITKDVGIALLFNNAVNGGEEIANVRNTSGERIRIIAISVTSRTGTSLRVQNKRANFVVGDSTAEIPLTNNVPTLLMWCRDSIL